MGFIGFILLAVVITGFLLMKNEYFAARDEKLGIENSPHRRSFTMHKTGPHAFQVGDRVQAIEASVPFETGIVQTLSHPGKPALVPAGMTTVLVRDEATGYLHYVTRTDIVKVA